MPDEVALAAALADLANQKTPNFKRTTKKHNVDRITLTRHYCHKYVHLHNCGGLTEPDAG
jgi:hypothetical protein